MLQKPKPEHLVFRLTFTCMRRCPSLNKQTEIRISRGLQARAMWVRRALQRAEPRAHLGFKGDASYRVLSAGFGPHYTFLYFALNARRAKREI